MAQPCHAATFLLQPHAHRSLYPCPCPLQGSAATALPDTFSYDQKWPTFATMVISPVIRKKLKGLHALAEFGLQQTSQNSLFIVVSLS